MNDPRFLEVVLWPLGFQRVLILRLPEAEATPEAQASIRRWCQLAGWDVTMDWSDAPPRYCRVCGASFAELQRVSGLCDRHGGGA